MTATAANRIRVDVSTHYVEDQSNPGEGIPSNCYVLNQVQGGKFVRVFPKKAGTFQCEKNNAYTIKLDLIK